MKNKICFAVSVLALLSLPLKESYAETVGGKNFSTLLKIMPEGKVLSFKKGKAEVVTVPDSASGIEQYTIEDKRLIFKDLDGDGVKDVAYSIFADTGGSGNFRYLGIFLLTKKGTVKDAQGLLVGDRVKLVAATSAAKGKITLTYLDRPEDQGMSEEPTIKKEASFSLNSKKNWVEKSRK